MKTDMQVEIKGIPAGSKVPAEMVGTWFFDNPHGDEEQMAVFPDGRVVVLYSNGHKDKTNGPTYYRPEAKHESNSKIFFYFRAFEFATGQKTASPLSRQF